MSCSNCKAALYFYNSYTCPKSNGCNKVFCFKCINNAVGTSSSSTFNSFCRSCFNNLTTLDLSSTYKTIRGPKNSRILVFLHGAGSTREMFLLHAKRLSNTYTSVLIDLPAHGSLQDEIITLDSSIETVCRVVAELELNCKKPVLIGGSLGGYIGMELIGRHPDMFEASIILMCGQNVGLNRGWAAGFGLIMMEYVFSMLSSASIGNLMNSEAKKNGHISKEIMKEIASGPGMFFAQASNYVKILRSTNPLQSLPKFKGKVLFINGSKDYRDSEHEWKNACMNGTLKVYQDADHFFSHDDRFIDRFIDDIDDFIKQI